MVSHGVPQALVRLPKMATFGAEELPELSPPKNLMGAACMFDRYPFYSSDSSACSGVSG